jgi:hypothetical protein
MYKCSSEKQVQREKPLRQLDEWLEKVIGAFVDLFLILVMEVS